MLKICRKCADAYEGCEHGCLAFKILSAAREKNRADEMRHKHDLDVYYKCTRHRLGKKYGG